MSPERREHFSDSDEPEEFEEGTPIAEQLEENQAQPESEADKIKSMYRDIVRRGDFKLLKKFDISEIAEEDLRQIRAEIFAEKFFIVFMSPSILEI